MVTPVITLMRVLEVAITGINSVIDIVLIYGIGVTIGIYFLKWIMDKFLEWVS